MEGDPSTSSVSPIPQVTASSVSPLLHFHVVTTNEHLIDCGGCLVLTILAPALRKLNYSASSGSDKSVITLNPQQKNVVIYPEVILRPATSLPGTLHVHWMLSPLGIIENRAKAISWWTPSDLVFHYGTESHGSTMIPVSHSNIPTLARNPYPGDDTDDAALANFKNISRKGLAFIIRKAKSFHKNFAVDTESYTQKSFERVDELRTNGADVTERLRSYEYFISYDPYSYWSFKAAMP